jgi:hypothetical protein
MSCLRLILELGNNQNFLQIYVTNYNISKYENFVTCNSLCLLMSMKILESKTALKKSYTENVQMTLLDYISKSIEKHNMKCVPPILGDVISVSTKFHYLKPTRK